MVMVAMVVLAMFVAVVIPCSVDLRAVAASAPDSRRQDQCPQAAAV
jgi:hypothetical protein